MLSIRIFRLKKNPLVKKSFSTDRFSWVSVLDKPKIQSPFDNPNRTLAKNNSESASIIITKNESALPLKEIFSVLPKKEPISEMNTHSSNSNLFSNSNTTDLSNYFSSNSASSASADTKNDFSSNVLSNNKVDSFYIRFCKKYGLYVDTSLSEQEQRTQRTTRTTKIGCFFVFGGIFVGFVWFCIKNGLAKRDESGQIILDEHSGQYFASFYRIADALYFWKKYITEPIRENLLPDPLKYPYHQPKYTVVIEMKNVLVNPEWTRPAVEYFLETVGYPQFELVLYTSESSMTAHSIVEDLDPNHKIFYRLYRECNKFMNGHYVKDLSRLNRDLSKVIYIDFDPKSFQLNPDNVLRVKKWEGDLSDTSLIDLAELLKTIFLNDVEDVRPILQYYSQFEDPAAEFRNRAFKLMEQEKKAEQEKKSQPTQLSRLTSGKFLGFKRHQSV